MIYVLFYFMWLLYVQVHMSNCDIDLLWLIFAKYIVYFEMTLIKNYYFIYFRFPINNFQLTKQFHQISIPILVVASSLLSLRRAPSQRTPRDPRFTAKPYCACVGMHYHTCCKHSPVDSNPFWNSVTIHVNKNYILHK